jgi:hypothetical protein
MFRYKAKVKIVTTHSVFVYAFSEEEAYEELSNIGFYDEDTAINTSIEVVEVESDGF